MLDTIFAWLLTPDHWLLPFIGAALWGAASVLLSPCGIAVVPLVVGYISDRDCEDDETVSRWQAFKISCAFCVGIIVNLLMVAFVTSSFGLLLGGHERILTFVTAGVFVAMGLHLTGLVRVRLPKFLSGHSDSGQQVRERHGLRGALTLGIVSGLAVGPCSIAYISPVLSISMSALASAPLRAICLVLSYALGYCAVLILAGTFAQVASSLLRGDGKALRVINALCGIGLIVAGVFLIREQLLLF